VVKSMLSWDKLSRVMYSFLVRVSAIQDGMPLARNQPGLGMPWEVVDAVSPMRSSVDNESLRSSLGPIQAPREHYSGPTVHLT